MGRVLWEEDSPWKCVGVHVTSSSVRDIRKVPVPRTEWSGEKPEDQ